MTALRHGATADNAAIVARLEAAVAPLAGRFRDAPGEPDVLAATVAREEVANQVVDLLGARAAIAGWAGGAPSPSSPTSGTSSRATPPGRVRPRVMAE